MKKSFLLLLTIISISAFSQKWKKKLPNILFAQDKNQSFSTVKVGIGLNNRSANFHIYSNTSIANIKLRNFHGSTEKGTNGNGLYIFF